MINQLATICTNIIKAQNLPLSENIQIGAKIIEMLAGGEGKVVTKQVAQVAPKPVVQEVLDTPISDFIEDPVEEEYKSPIYDPVGDPDTPPPAKSLANAVVIAKAGNVCLCASCQKVGYKLAANLTDPMLTKEFFAAVEPVDHGVKLDSSCKISNIDGNISTRCPHCGGDKLYLVGSNPDGDAQPGGSV
jgi:hypothetical protein